MSKPIRRKPLDKPTLVARIQNATYAQILNCSDSELLVKRLTYHIKGWDKTKNRPKFWKRYALTKTKRVLVGLLELLKEDFDITIRGRVEPPAPTEKPNIKNIEWREDQEPVLETAMGVRRGLIVAPMAFGKTVVMAGLLKAWSEIHWIVIVHLSDLLKQTIEELEGFLEEKVGQAGAGKFDLSKRITVAMRQSLNKIPTKERKDFQGVVVDEAHHAHSPQYASFLYGLHNAYVRFGFTGTPLTSGRNKAGWLKTTGFFGPIISEVEEKELVEKKVLTDVEVEFIETPINMDLAFLGSTWHHLYREGIADNLERNRLVAQVAESLFDDGFESVLIPVSWDLQGERLFSLFQRHRIPCTYLTSKSTEEERDKMRKLVDKGIGGIVIYTPIWGEGMNFRKSSAVVVAGAGESPILATQRVRRARAKGKDFLTVVDFFDISHEILRKHSKSRIRHYRKRGWKVRGFVE